MKAIEQYFHVVLFIVLYKVVLTFESVDETLVCDHLNKSYWAVVSSGAVCFWQFCEMKFNIFPLNLALLGVKGLTLICFGFQICRLYGKFNKTTYQEKQEKGQKER